MKSKIIKIASKQAEKAFKEYIRLKLDIAPLEEQLESSSKTVKAYLETQPEKKAVLAGISVSLSEVEQEHLKLKEAKEGLDNQIIDLLRPFITMSKSLRIIVPWKQVHAADWMKKKAA